MRLLKKTAKATPPIYLWKKYWNITIT